MHNEYKLEVRARCPLHSNLTDVYLFIIRSDHIIMCETIKAFFAKHAGKNKVFQEDLTKLAAVTLGAKVRSEGLHDGVLIVCEC